MKTTVRFVLVVVLVVLAVAPAVAQVAEIPSLGTPAPAVTPPAPATPAPVVPPAPPADAVAPPVTTPVMPENPAHANLIADLRDELDSAREGVERHTFRSLLTVFIGVGIVMFILGWLFGLRFPRRRTVPPPAQPGTPAGPVVITPAPATPARTGGPAVPVIFAALLLGTASAYAQAPPVASQIISVTPQVVKTGGNKVTVSCNAPCVPTQVGFGVGITVANVVAIGTNGFSMDVTVAADKTDGVTRWVMAIGGTTFVAPAEMSLHVRSSVIDTYTDTQVRAVVDPAIAANVAANKTALDAAVAAIRRQVAAARDAHKVAGYATQAYLNNRIKGLASSDALNAVATATYTKAEVDALIARTVSSANTDLQMVNAALQAAVAEHASKIGVHGEAIVGLAEGQVALGEKKGGRRYLGLVGGKPTDPEVAEAAARIRAAVLAVK